MIVYKTIKDFSKQEIEDLFLSVHWESGKYPEKIVKGLANSSVVISAWDNDRLIGLVRGLDDGATVGFLHYLLVHPAYQGQQIGEELVKRILAEYQDLLYVKIMPSDLGTLGFYRRFGFEVFDNYAAMEIKRV